MDTTQWVIAAAVAAVLIWPRREAITGLFSGISNSTAEPEANDVAAAYRLIAPYLDDATAVDVRRQIADRYLGSAIEPVPVPAPVPVESSVDWSKKLIEGLTALLASAKENKK